MGKLTVIFGNGAIGHLVSEKLLADGHAVRIAQRKRPDPLPAAASYFPCDILDPEAVRQAVQGASQVLLAVGFLYDARLWRTAWPTAMRNVIDACAAVDARVVFIDNLYQLGAQTTARTEEMSLTTVGDKPVILAQITRMWMAARDRVRFAALRCPDFTVPVSAIPTWARPVSARSPKASAPCCWRPTPRTISPTRRISRAPC